ncbi:hypothetical protein [Desulfovulcanus sp.]
MSKKTFFLVLTMLVCLGVAVFLIFYFNQSGDMRTQDAGPGLKPVPSVRYRINRNDTDVHQVGAEARTDAEDHLGTNATNGSAKVVASGFSDEKHNERLESAKIDDKVLTPNFIEDLAEVIFEHYLPQEKRLTLTFKQINMRYGLYFYGLDYMEDDVLQIRREIFGHLLRPFIIDRLSPVVAVNLTKRIVDIALNKPKEFRQGSKKVFRILTRSEVAELLASLARKVRNISYIFVDYARNGQVDELMREYFQAVELLKKAYFNYWQLKDEEHGQMERLGRKIKQGIVAREKIKGQIRALLTSSGGQRGSSEVIYVAKWIYRRINTDKVSRDVIKALGQAGLAWAKQLEEEAQKMREG